MRSKILQSIDLTQVQQQILVGSLLGDGSLDKISGLRNSRFVEIHGSSQKNYLYWKRNLLVPFVGEIREKMVSKAIKLTNGKIGRDDINLEPQYNLRTYTHCFFTKLEHEWYLRDTSGSYVLNYLGRRIKIIPANLKLTPLICAVWFMDDGHNRIRKREAAFASMGFTIEECYFLMSLLKELSIETYITKSRVIHIRSQSYLDFINLTKNAIDKIGISFDMKYKFDLTQYKSPAKLERNTIRDKKGRIVSTLSMGTVSKILAMEQNHNIKHKIIAKTFNINVKTLYNLLNKHKPVGSRRHEGYYV